MTTENKTRPTEREPSPLTTLSAPRPFVQHLKVLAAHHEITITEALERFAAPAVAKECRRVVEALGKQFDLGGES